MTSPDGGRSMRLAEGVAITVGRDPSATLSVPDPHVSAVHVRFTLTPGGRVTVEDLGSSNGTWIAGRRVDRAEVLVGDEVVVGYATTARVMELRRGSELRMRASPSIVAGPVMRTLLATAARAATARLPVILLGETGTGKEVLARFIHERGPRSARPMVSVNCAAIPAHLVESTLFGHEKGAFTGADGPRRGVFEAANGGTVFLDEIGELTPSAQAALLRVVETHRFTRVGATRETEVDVRVVAATHRDLEHMCAVGAFRADLFFRLSALTLTVPPLRDRREDIEPLAVSFLRGADEGAGKSLSPAALARLRAYAWPGNVRELRNAIERAAVLAGGTVVQEHELPARLLLTPEPVDAEGPPQSSRGPSVVDAPSAGGDLRAQLDEHQRRLLRAMLEAVAWDRPRAAERLGLPLRTLAHRMQILGIRRPRG